MSKWLFDGTAWLSSVRVVKCNIKLFNERNPYHMFYLIVEHYGYAFSRLTESYHTPRTKRKFNPKYLKGRSYFVSEILQRILG